jgi:RecB family endonuclease NucS
MLTELSPSSQKALELVYGNGGARSMILILGECSVSYQGRAKSYLDWGDRLVIVKKDGAVLVHQGETREPVNWQPPGTRPTYHSIDERFVIRAQRTRARELMKIEFRRIDLLTMKELTDKAELQLAGMEEDIVQKIMENPSIVEEGLRVSDKERKTASGSIDLFCRDKDGCHVILEVKRGNPGISAAYQLEAYSSDFKRKNPDCSVRAVLVAPRIPLMVKNRLMKKGLEYREINVKFDLVDDSQSLLKDWVST